MNLGALGAFAGAVLGSTVAILAGSQPNASVPAGLFALASAAAFGVLLLRDRARWSVVEPPSPGGGPGSVFVEGFQGSPLGRQAIVGAVASLERALPPDERRSLSLREEQELLASSPDTFDAWVRLRLDRLEQET